MLKKRKIVQNISLINNINNQTDITNLITFNEDEKDKSKKMPGKSQINIKEGDNINKKGSKKKTESSKSKEKEINIMEDKNEISQKESKKIELKQKKDKTIKIINPIENPNIKQIAEKVKEAEDYYKQVKESYNNWNEYQTKFEMTNVQKEKIISDYFIEINNNIPGISYKINNQLDYMKKFIKYDYQIKSLQNFFKLTKKGLYDFIISCVEINRSSIFAICPEYNSFIINGNDNNKFSILITSKEKE